MPRGTTAISPGATASGPSSVCSAIAPCSGTNSSSPSASTKYLLVMDWFAAYTCAAIPLRVLMSPLPATV
jgi:hypothetical protein